MCGAVQVNFQVCEPHVRPGGLEERVCSGSREGAGWAGGTLPGASLQYCLWCKTRGRVPYSTACCTQGSRASRTCMLAAVGPLIAYTCSTAEYMSVGMKGVRRQGVVHEAAVVSLGRSEATQGAA